MLTTVLAEFASPRLLGRFGYRAVFAAGALLLGGPAPALLLPHSMATIIAVSIARGIGFGLATVVLGALVAASVPAERRGEGIGLAGVVACVPAIVALPSGVWLAQNTGYAVVIAITAISALAPLAAAPWLADPGDTGQQAGSGQGETGAARPRPKRLRQACWAACAPAACCGPAWSSRPRPYRPAWWPRSCRWRRACPRASPRSGCSRRP